MTGLGVETVYIGEISFVGAIYINSDQKYQRTQRCCNTGVFFNSCDVYVQNKWVTFCQLITDCEETKLKTSLAVCASLPGNVLKPILTYILKQSKVNIDYRQSVIMSLCVNKEHKREKQYTTVIVASSNYLDIYCYTPTAASIIIR